MVKAESLILLTWLMKEEVSIQSILVVTQGEKDDAVFDDSHEAGGGGKNHVEDNRCGKQVVDPSYVKSLENGLEFDWYEPYYIDDKKELKELQDVSLLCGSSTRSKSIEKKEKEKKKGIGQNDHHETLYRPSNPASRKTCYL